MTYKEFRDLVLQHIDAYSVAGDTIPCEYNNQADKLNRIPALTNIVLRNIATQTFPITQTLHPSDANFSGVSDFGGGWSKITMPTDFWRLSGSGICMMKNGSFEKCDSYRFLTSHEILVRSADLPQMIIVYNRYPRRVKGVEIELLDCTDAVADCASFYVAAELMRTEDSYVYQSLYNEYESMLARLAKPVRAEYVAAQDVYAVPSFY